MPKLSRQNNNNVALYFYLLFTSTEALYSSLIQIWLALLPLPYSFYSVPDLVTGTWEANILFFTLANFFFHFSITSPLIMVLSISQLILSIKFLPLTVCIPALVSCPKCRPGSLWGRHWLWIYVWMFTYPQKAPALNLKVLFTVMLM